MFGGFSAEALRDRINDAGAKVVVTADGGYRRGAPFALKPAVDEALRGRRAASSTSSSCGAPASPSRCSPAATTGGTTLVAGASADCPPAKLDAEHPLFILYTSGTTGQAEGHPAHDGRLPRRTSPTTAKAIFDLKDDDIYWCTADIGWVTGHSYVVYGPLANGATMFMYEGVPTHPGARPLVGR